MESYFEQYKSSTIHYRQSSKQGKPVLLCFHGYGETAASFDFLEKYTSEDFSLLAIDFPFHGQTVWKEGLDFTPQDLTAIIEKIAQKKEVDFSRWRLVGYSMGGRVALGLVEYRTEKIEKVLLLAPDGLHMNGWYWLATQQKPGNYLFRILMKKGGFFLGMVHALNRLGWINQSIYKFMNHYIKNKQVRIDLYNRWTTMRRFKPNLEKIKNCITHHQIPVRLLYGRYDRIIRFENGLRFQQGITDYCDLEIIETGHQVLSEKNIGILLGLLKE